MGTINGVTTSKVTATKWTHWGELQGVDYSDAGDGSEGTGESPATAGGGNIAGDKVNRNEQSPQCGAATIEVADTAKPTLRKGSKGAAVTELQTMLLKLGYDLGPCGIDGDFGKATEVAVRSFQSDHRLMVDGVVGKNTWAELINSEFRIHNSELSPAGGGNLLYRVIISGLDLTQAHALVNNYPGSTMEEL
ncbi:MAG: peptidoglycan-binding protein [Clostridia bacterium]|nr:peptidoglycan-binding protein [Clostridia bacterium]